MHTKEKNFSFFFVKGRYID